MPKTVVLRRIKEAATRVKALEAGEVGQIAGRAGRHMNSGTFGTTAGVGPLAAETIELVEQHRFQPVELLQWRNSRLDHRSIDALLRSLEARPDSDVLVRGRPAADYIALKALSQDHEVTGSAAGPAAVGRLWAASQRRLAAQCHFAKNALRDTSPLDDFTQLFGE